MMFKDLKFNVFFGILVFCIIFSTRLYSQNKSANIKMSDIKVYVFPDRYGNDAKSFFIENNFISSVLLTKSMIDPKNSGKVDLNLLADNIVKHFPNQQDEGVIFVDWEEPFSKMKSSYKNSRQFQTLEVEYLKIVSLIRKIRPSVKVGIYGLPFTAFDVKWPVMDVNKNNRFDRILKECDFVCPAIYVRFPNSEVGEDKNLKYINDNLDVAFDYSLRLNKPVVPFVWSYVHPNNKKFGNTLLSDNEMKFYLDKLFSYNNSGKHIGGIIWFDSKSLSSQKRSINTSDNLKSRDNKIIKSLERFIK